MERCEKLLFQILRGTSDANTAFDDLCQLLLRLGFEERKGGSHHIFRKAGIEEKINLQRDDGKAKPYQVRQVRAVILKYKLGGDLSMHKYEIIIHWSNEDRVFVAEVPELPGCMAHGETEEVALKNIKDAIQLWIDTAREFGDPVPEPKGRRLMYA
jgi:predicted RNase H-like HicB family nuclease